MQLRVNRYRPDDDLPVPPIDKVIEALKARGHDVRESGTSGQWVSTCPAHPDNSPSLSIGEGNDGRCLMHCFAGCEAADIVERLDLSEADLFVGGGDNRPRERVGRVVVKPEPELSSHCCQVMEACHHATTPESLEAMAGHLGVSTASLARIGAGVNSTAIMAIPMHNSSGNIIGVRYRAKDGFKWAEETSRSGLFLPSDLNASSGRLVVVEGPTDLAAALDLGVEAIGRPSATGGVQIAVALLKRLQIHEGVLVIDRDEAGVKGAARLMDAIRQTLRMDIRYVLPPEGCKDLRAWKAAGLTAHDFQHIVANAKKLEVTHAG